VSNINIVLIIGATHISVVCYLYKYSTGAFSAFDKLVKQKK